MKNLVTLLGQLQSLEPQAEKTSRRAKFEQQMARMVAQREQRQAEHVKERLGLGLAENAGTGEPGPERLIHGMPIDDLDFKDAERTLDEQIEEIAASKVRRDARTLAALPINASRIGGLPDLPPDEAWPTFAGKRIPFIAQIDLGAFPHLDGSLLPARGHLFAFTLISNDKAHWPPPVRVVLFDGESNSLKRAKRPADDEIWADWHGERVYEVIPATATPAGRDATKRSREFGETLGWLEGTMDGVFGTADEGADARLADGDDWINLMAVHSEGSMLWSDAGHLYLLIRRSALRQGDYSGVIAASCSS